MDVLELASDAEQTASAGRELEMNRTYAHIWWVLKDGALVLNVPDLSPLSRSLLACLGRDEFGLICDVVVDEIWAGRAGDDGEYILSRAPLIKGFRDPRKAPKASFANALKQSEMDADGGYALARIWNESHDDIYQAVSKRLLSYQPSSREEHVRHLDGERFEVIVDQIARQTGLCKRRIAITVKMYVNTSILNRAMDDLQILSDASEEMNLRLTALNKALADVHAMSSVSADWNRVADILMEIVEQMRSEKIAELISLSDAASSLVDVVDQNADFLDYFGARVGSWRPLAYLCTLDSASLVGSADALRAVFDRLRALQGPAADSYGDELKRRAALMDAESDALDAIAAVDKGLIANLPSFDDASTEESVDDSGQLREGSETEDVEVAGSDGEADAQFGRLKARVAELEVELQAERASGIAAENEMADLLKKSEQGERYWRSQYAAAVSQSEDVVAPDALPEGLDEMSMLDVIELIESSLSDRIAFRLNSHSDERSDYYWRPDELYIALQWLANDYRDARLLKGGNPNVAQSLMEANGWFYRPFQSDNKIGMYPEWYRTHYDGREIILKKHIGKGRRLNPSRIIRVAFEFDKLTEKVVVGYIGRHQRDQNS